MPLDIHIAKKEKEAVKKPPVFSFSELDHNLLFHTARLPQSKYPLFFRMNNYYSDTKYDIEETETLRMEIIKIETEFKRNEQIVEVLESLKSTCIKAQKENQNIWVYCD